MSHQETRLIFKHIDEEGYTNDIDCYVKNGGYDQLKKAVTMQPEDICAEVLTSGVRGRGGAGFPAGMKWKFLDRKSGKPIYLICNADESEPGPLKDPQNIHQDPQQLIPTGRLSVHFQNTRTQQHAYNVLSQRLPDMHFCTCECTLAKPFESHVNNQIAGTLQLCCFLQREDISRDIFVTRWLDDHTSVALETQCTVGYRQNLVTQRPDQEDDKRPTLTFDAIVEEYFPTEASTSTAHFFDAADNPIRLKENVARMHKSCMRFISFSTIMVIHLTDRRII